ncbi:SRPBCC family protein [Mycolicibacterium sp. 050158]|jgi:Polyketide cyclase / dehydrase and lipid transport|uniref:SRPBCC family protein n=1 Tax=Mycolicibacterium sp. 050158 TaxID=3090602 RepID=UPI00299E31E9|nr:SRPBCC family protein [Mycolicibacterium sp. 050158]MDX1889497.1 SRPBCC family protein [Mycolicibacterium sp. 050158]
MTGPSAAASIAISASCADVYALITDLPTMATLAEEADAMVWHRGAGASPGAVFKGHNTNRGKTWTTKCTVTDAEPGRVFAFDVRTAGIVPVAHWRYDIEPIDGGCRVTEQTWDRRPGWIRKPAELTTGVSDRTAENAKNIELTLQRLKARAEAGPTAAR